ncbi:MAG: hypothetical protein JWM54_1711 [Acidobacteriaceae bacterium]|nr:hypothetical protein [Acidobacteriaceae bacterium]
MADKDAELAIFQAAIALSGLLLVFIGFLLGRADQTGLKSNRIKVKLIALGGLVPFLAALSCSLEGVWALQGARCSAMYLFSTFKIVLAFTAIYAILAAVYDVR